MTRSACAGLGGASAARPSKYVTALLRAGTPFFFSSLKLPVALAGSLATAAMLLKSLQNFPVSLPTPAGTGAGEVSTATGWLGPAAVELLELPLQAASVTHAPATTLITRAARLAAGMLLPP